MDRGFIISGGAETLAYDVKRLKRIETQSETDGTCAKSQ